MLRITRGIVFVFTIATAAGQEAGSAGCQSAAGQEEFFAAVQRLDAVAQGPKLGTLAPEFQQKLAEHPEDGRYLYLYGRALMGSDTKEALAQLNRSSGALPKLPWTYISLAEIYASRNFYDPVKVVQQMRSFRTLCPSNVVGFRYLDKVVDATESGLLARELRALLVRRSEREDAPYWRLLWGAEFRSTPEADYPRLRQQVAEDLRRLADLAAGGNRAVLAALMDGYKLTHEAEAADRIARRLDVDSEVNKEYDAWIAKSEIRTRTNITVEERAAFNVEYAKAAAAWVQRWPDSGSAWEFRTMTLSGLPDSSKEEIEKAGLEELRIDASRDRQWTFVPVKLRVAQHWLRKGVRPADCVRMAEEALAQIQLGPADPNDMSGSRGTRSFSFDAAMWDAMGAVVDGALQLRDFGKAGHMLQNMQQWLDDNRAKKADPASGYDQFRGRYLLRAGALAEAQGHKLDAVSLYVESINAGWRDPDAVKHARELWNQAGGTEDGWKTLTRRSPPASTTPPRPTAPVAAANVFAAWKDLGRPLPEMNLRDGAGKMWSASDFKGKTTLLNVWATWCGPCWDELPHLQKLHEMVKDRQDLQVVTISIDQNPGEVEPFLTSKHYTFPALELGLPYVEQFIGPVSVPRNWIVDAGGVVRQESLGFDMKIADWPAEMVKRLDSLKVGQ